MSDQAAAKCGEGTCSICGAKLPKTLRGMKPRDICEGCEYERDPLAKGDGMGFYGDKT
jgi:hypothetical protein